MDFQSGLAEVLDRYQGARAARFANHPLAAYIRHDLADEIQSRVGPRYVVKGSPGLGNWAETPWVAVFDPTETDTAQHGIYVVYLFRQDGLGVYLSLNQGTTAVLAGMGFGLYLSELRKRAAEAVARLPSWTTDEIRGPIQLSGRGSLSRGYEAGNISARYYPRPVLPTDSALERDLQLMLVSYQRVIQQLGGKKK